MQSKAVVKSPSQQALDFQEDLIRLFHKHSAQMFLSEQGEFFIELPDGTRIQPQPEVKH